MNPADHDTHVVYSLHSGGQLLYIGCTNNIATRMEGHRADKPWWPDVTRVETEFRGAREAAYQRERELIMTLQPPRNVRHTSRDPMPWMRPGYQLTLSKERSAAPVSPVNERIAAQVRYELAKPRVGTRQVAELLDLNMHAARRRLAGEVPFRADELLALSRLLNVPVDRFYSDARTPPGGVPVVVATEAAP